MLHVNCQEMEAVFLTLEHFQYKVHNKTVLIRCDTTTLVQFIRKQGVIQISTPLSSNVGTLELSVCLKATHIAEKMNIQADHLSRV